MTATDTLRQTVTLTVHDTVREITTITIQTNADGDTTRLTTNTDRERITTQDRTALQTHATTQTTTQTATQTNTKETITNPILPIQPTTHKSPIKPLLISFLLGLLLIPLIKLCRHLKRVF